MAPSTAPRESGAADAADVWLPIPPAQIDGLPDTFTYRFWDGDEDFPADPARCAFYVVPYMKGQAVSVRPLPEMTRLRVVQTLTAGIDHVAGAVPDLPAGTLLCNARGVHDASTAELALALTLAALRQLPAFVRAQDAEEWSPGVHDALADKSVLIVGYGAIGSAVEDRLVPFEVAEVTRVARTARQAPRGPVHALGELPRLLPGADVAVLCTPLTEETRGLVDAGFLSRMKDGALLVNVARGGVVETDSLLAEASSGRLRAALDVTDPEPLPAGHPLWHAPGVLITPHVGGPTTAFLPRAKRLLRAQLDRWARGEPLQHIVAVAE
ncbi:phosphoglycerate dehydrogenase-like enzyme [Streptomyces sp. Amel2xB2]|uniref:2-hydroxyacid dehydrogenase n=1 Tax=Streptomyces sp. Amel2xB2 TaxID=1305829 RepID=UPI000DBA1EC0|nr:2-hydroxyacid dehydrogenase [Streptomyces sp. Amel2xB2]RAJ63397.1 phosphoglycerate dehydrogenase-like enzyme [Streptomyces sp. Amel2xB2]